MDTRLIQRSHWSLTKRNICAIFVYTLPRKSTLNVNSLNKEFVLDYKKARSRCYPAETITDTNYTDNFALLANSPTETESLLHNQGQEAKASLWIQIKPSTSLLNKSEPFPLKMASL